MEGKTDPLALLARVNRDLKLMDRESGAKRSLWHDLDLFIPETRAAIDIRWPESVFMPFGLWPCFIERHLRLPSGCFNLHEPHQRGMAQALSCLAPWRATQDIVAFDPDVERELRGMDLDGKLPCAILERLPAWCVYVDAALEVDGDSYDGFFAQLDILRDTMYLALTFQGSEMRQQRIPVALGDYTLAESISEVNRRARLACEALVSHADRGLIQALNLVIFLCAYGLGKGPERPEKPGVQRTKAKKVWRIFPPAKPRRWVLGEEAGSAMRGSGSGASGWTVRPHIRRPHWHHYWIGGAEKRLEVRWLAPIFVGSRERGEWTEQP